MQKNWPNLYTVSHRREEMTGAAAGTAAAVVGVLLALAGVGAAAPALFVFGDSLVDAGNNNALSCRAKANFYPYGVDFGSSSGRFCNGKTVVDALCDLFGVGYLPPNTSPGLGAASMLAGVNYASASGGILDETGRHLGERISLSQQVLNLESNLDGIRSQLGRGYGKFLARSIAVMVLGSNDYINNYLLASLYDSSQRYSPEQFADLLINHYTRQILALHSIGMRRFFLAGVGPLGCIPSMRNSGQAPPGQCVDKVNQAVGYFNQGLRSLVDQLNADHPGAVFVYADTYAAVQDMLFNPSKYGFMVVDRGCCGLGQDVMCLPLAKPCDHRNHPTQAVNVLLAQKAFNGTPDHVFPVNLQQLANL